MPTQNLLLLMFCRGYEVESRCWILEFANILKFNFSQDVHVWLTFRSFYLLEILKMKFDQYLCDMNSTLRSVVPVAMFIFSIYIFEFNHKSYQVLSAHRLYQELLSLRMSFIYAKFG